MSCNMRWVGVGLLGVLLVAGCGDAESSTSSDVSSFVGRWYQHAGSLSISPNGDVDMTYQVDMAPAPAMFPELKLHIDSVDSDKATATVISSTDPQVKTGDSFTLWRTEPGIVVTTPQGGSHEWCDEKNKELGACGA